MAELNARIIAKASATATEEPLAADLEVAELAVNTADGKLFTKHTDGSVVTISGGGGGGAVDSVNGQTGVVSLGIQDMDDVVSQGPPSWNQNKSGSNLLCPDATYYAATSSGPNNWIQISATDVSGGNLQTWFNSWVTGDMMSVTVNGGAVMTEALDDAAPNETYCRIDFQFGTDTIFNAIAAAGVNGIVTIQNDTRPYYVSSAPSDGQILVYDAASGLWEAADTISKSTFQSELAASTDFADFQSRIAAL